MTGNGGDFPAGGRRDGFSVIDPDRPVTKIIGSFHRSLKKETREFTGF